MASLSAAPRKLAPARSDRLKFAPSPMIASKIPPMRMARWKLAPSRSAPVKSTPLRSAFLKLASCKSHPRHSLREPLIKSCTGSERAGATNPSVRSAAVNRRFIVSGPSHLANQSGLRIVAAGCQQERDQRATCHDGQRQPVKLPIGRKADEFDCLSKGVGARDVEDWPSTRFPQLP